MRIVNAGKQKAIVNKLLSTETGGYDPDGKWAALSELRGVDSSYPEWNSIDWRCDNCQYRIRNVTA